MRRRTFLAALPAAVAAAHARGGAAPARCQLGLVIHSYGVRRARPLPPDFPALDEPLAFVEHAARVGAAGMQVAIPPRPARELARLAGRAAELGVYVEGIVSLPREPGEADHFAADLAAARAAGATVVRTVCLNGRRYEQFTRAEDFAAFARRAEEALRRAEPPARRAGVRLAVENHKDWRVDEFLPLLRRLDSEYVGVCLDTGNSMALLEEPHQVVEAYAPYTLTTHFKDMAVAEYEDGFLLAEVPLGEGCLDLPRVVATLRRARPEVRLNLEMITRDPLRVPCLTERYWATLGRVTGRELADALGRVRRQRYRGELPVISNRSHQEQLRAEEDNVRRSFAYARQRLGL